MNIRRTSREAGLALLTALLVAALASVTVMAMAARHQRGVDRTGYLLDRDQVGLRAQSVEAWASRVLARDRHDSRTDHLSEPWARPVPSGAMVDTGSMGIEDMQARFNLTNLLQGDQLSRSELSRLRRLLRVLELPPGLADALADWLDADHWPRPGDGAEDAYYLGLRPPYRSANGPISSLGELRLVKGVSAAVYRTLAPFVAVLPQPTRVNINTASAAVVASVVEGLGAREAAALVASRPAAGYPTLDAFLAAPQLQGKRTELDAIALSSDHFRLYARLSVGRAHADLDTLLARGSDGRVSVVARSLGGG